MRLLNTETLEVKEFLVDIPTYAILSHTWEKEEEVELKDIQDCQRLPDIQGCRNFEEAKDRAGWKKAGWRKIWNACKYVQQYKFEWIWIDTCCIDKTSSAELSEALNSMYKYYREGRVCIAYLSDVLNGRSMTGLEQFKKSRWFERGWTLQELIAPRHVVFLDQKWNMIGTRYSMRHIVSEVTAIPVNLFEGHRSRQREEPEDYSIAQRMSWAASRRTTREEDMAYCLMGLFGVNMSPIYGEGGAKAFMRLQLEIIKYSDDRSIFAWVALEDYQRDRGLFASSPSEFAFSGTIKRSDSKDLGEKSSFSFGNNGLRIPLHLQPVSDTEKGVFFASLHCRDANGVIGIDLRKDGHRYVRWCPHFPLQHTDKPVGTLQEVVVKESPIPRPRPIDNDIPIEFELDSELTLLGRVYNDGTLRSIRSLLFTPHRARTFRLKTKNGNEFDFRLCRYASDDVIPFVPGIDRSVSIFRDSCLLLIDNGNGLASCFVHKTGYSSKRSNIEINYIPSSSPQFEYYDHINKFRYTSHGPSSVALNFTVDAGPFRYYLPEETKTAFFEYFKPALIEFAGCGIAWEDPDSDELQGLWAKVMPSELKGQYSQFHGAISEMATESLKVWRNSIGEAAITILDQILDGKNEEERKTFIKEQINSKDGMGPYYYPENNVELPADVFQSRIVSETFATHFEIIKNIPDDSHSEALPKAALVLSIVAIDRAFLFSECDILPDDFSSYQQAKDSSQRLHEMISKTPDGQVRISAQTWSQIIAAAKAHVKPQTSKHTSSISLQDEEEMPDEFL
ncbi:HET-domain-containing protein [Dendrothele bispora CBS 962.96]|uniref:HET-domain-containing protein n=1 Tax=Dendrothele bispora (strain CBS 962.96) TaxID=1314807 RepID=A0A4S8LTR4_DENBC|nr:HET-domain-containing protein [Dendrothele bispora CBS 962.96]